MACILTSFSSNFRVFVVMSISSVSARAHSSRKVSTPSATVQSVISTSLQWPFSWQVRRASGPTRNCFPACQHGSLAIPPSFVGGHRIFALVWSGQYSGGEKSGSNYNRTVVPLLKRCARNQSHKSISSNFPAWIKLVLTVLSLIICPSKFFIWDYCCTNFWRCNLYCCARSLLFFYTWS